MRPLALYDYQSLFERYLNNPEGYAPFINILALTQKIHQMLDEAVMNPAADVPMGAAAIGRGPR